MGLFCLDTKLYKFTSPKAYYNTISTLMALFFLFSMSSFDVSACCGATRMLDARDSQQPTPGRLRSSVVIPFAHGAMGRRIDPSWSTQCSTTGATMT